MVGDDQKKGQDDKGQGVSGAVAHPEQEPSQTRQEPSQTRQEPGGGGGESENVGIKETPGEHREIEKKREVGEFVKEVPQRPEIPEEVEKAGVKHAGSTAPVGKKPTKQVKLPLTDDEIVKGLHAHVWQSIRWLALWCVRKLKKAHVMVKEVHGRLVRS
jgi:hypothetical protein